MTLEFVTASHNEETLKNNLLRSAIVKRYPLTVKRNYTNVPKAYNEVRTKADIIIYVHNDVFLPDTFEHDLKAALTRLRDQPWGTVGVAGVSAGRVQHGYILDRGRVWGSPYHLPAEVDTLDELMLIQKRETLAVFDERFPLDFYGADLCTAMRKRIGLKCYAISAYCEHNSSREFGGRTPSFYESEKLFRDKWRDHLPISTTCTIVT